MLIDSRHCRRLTHRAYLRAKSVQYDLRLWNAGLGCSRWHPECLQHYWSDSAFHLVVGWSFHLERKDVQTSHGESVPLLRCEAVRRTTFELVGGCDRCAQVERRNHSKSFMNCPNHLWRHEPILRRRWQGSALVETEQPCKLIGRSLTNHPQSPAWRRYSRHAPHPPNQLARCSRSQVSTSFHRVSS